MLVWIQKQIQGDHGGMRLSLVDFDLAVPLSAGAWAGENWAEMSEQPGNLAKRHNQSQQNTYSLKSQWSPCSGLAVLSYQNEVGFVRVVHGEG